MDNMCEIIESKQFIRKIEKKKYKLLSKIGEGAFGIIYTAMDIRTSEQLAIKVVEIKSKNRMKVIEKEVKILSFFKGKSSIVQLRNFFQFKIRISAFQKQKYAVIVMEKMEIDLMDYILSKGKISEKKAKFLFHEICVAVQVCHKQGVAHLDIKPDNVLLNFGSKNDVTQNTTQFTEDMDFSELFNLMDKKSSKEDEKKKNGIPLEVKLCDFGFTHFWKDEKIPKFVGTKEYLPPEIRFHSNSYLPPYFRGDKADIWSLGVVLFCMITGLFPFIYENKNIYAVNFDIVTCNTKDGSCMDLLEKMFDPTPECRPSIEEVLNHPWLRDYHIEDFEENFKSYSTPALRSFSKPRLQTKFQKIICSIASQI